MQKYLLSLAVILSLVLVPSLTLAQVSSGATGNVKTIKLLNPNGREFLALDQPFRIKWETTLKSPTNAKPEMVKIQWVEIINQNVGTINILDANRGYYDWTPTAAVGIVPGQTYTILVTSMSNPRVNDQSDNTFTIKPSVTQVPTVRVISPKLGEIWVKSNTKKVTWTTTNVPTTALMNIRIVNAKNQVVDLLRRVPNTGSANWVVGKTADGANLPAGKYRMRVCVAGILGGCDRADSDMILEIKDGVSAGRNLGAIVADAMRSLFGF